MGEGGESGARGDTTERLYVYAIGAADIAAPAHVATFGGPLIVVRSGALGAVVSRLRPSERAGQGRASREPNNDSVVAAPAATRENLLRHETAVEAICAGAAALPVRFGVILPDGVAVEQALARQADALSADLLRIGDKVEVGVIALWNPAAAAEATEGERAAMKSQSDAQSVDQPDAQAAEQRPGLAYLRARQAQYERSAATRARAERLGGALDVELRPRPLQTQRALCPSRRLALRDVYLLERAQVDAFGQTFEDARRRHAAEARLLMSGPWPPYSFVSAPRPTASHDSAGAAREKGYTHDE
jgi:hypothetical protein